jgi:zinc transporter ZupT
MLLCFSRFKRLVQEAHAVAAHNVPAGVAIYCKLLLQPKKSSNAALHSGACAVLLVILALVIMPADADKAPLPSFKKLLAVGQFEGFAKAALVCCRLLNFIA